MPLPSILLLFDQGRTVNLLKCKLARFTELDSSVNNAGDKKYWSNPKGAN